MLYKKQREQNILSKHRERIMGVCMLFVLIMMSFCGCGNSFTPWAGYKADAANGRYVKRVEFLDQKQERLSWVEYDVEGNITEAVINHPEYKFFFDKVMSQISVPYEGIHDMLWMPSAIIDTNVEPTVYGSIKEYFSERDIKDRFSERDPKDRGRDLHMSICDQGRKIVFSRDMKDLDDDYSYTGALFLSPDGQIMERAEASIIYNRNEKKRSVVVKYDKNGRLTSCIVISTYRGDSGMDSWSEIKYTYEGDSTYPMETKDSYHRGDHYGDYSYRYKYRYDDKNNLIERKKYTPRSDYDTTEGVLIRIDEYEYDSQGNRTLHKWRYGTDDGEEIKTTRYQYDKKGNLIEECLYEFIGDKEYVTSKVEYEHFEGMTACKARETSYQYEANSDYTIVNLRETDEGEWVWALGPYNEGYDEVHKDCWKVTYYTQEEIDQYWHDKEFSPVN